MKKIIDKYIQRIKEYETERDRIENKINLREKQIERLKKKLSKLDCPSWIDEILKPIAGIMLKKLPNRYYDILGPFGLDSNTSIHFYKKGVNEKNRFTGDNCISITFNPFNLREGLLAVKDYTIDTHRYVEGSIGEVNDGNHPTIPIEANIEWLMNWLKKQNKNKKEIR